MALFVHHHHLYNWALKDRIETYRNSEYGLNFSDQCNVKDNVKGTGTPVGTPVSKIMDNEQTLVSDELIQTTPQDIRRDPTVIRLLERMPKSVQESFDDEQLMHIRNAVGARNWGNHSVDWRGVLTVPMLKWRYYYVFLIGKNRRELSAKEKLLSLWAGAVFMTGFTVFAVLCVLLILYLIKSALGIDLFPGFSLGIWTWFKANVL